MQGPIESLGGTVTTKAVAIHTTGVTAAGASVAPQTLYYDFLVDSGWILPWSDWIKIFGALYMFLLILNMLGILPLIKKGASWLARKIIDKCRKNNQTS